MSLGIVIHVILSYFPMAGDGWPYTDPAAKTDEVGLVFDFIHLFRMPAFFLLAGFFAALLWERRGPKTMLLNRFDRLALPFGIFILLLKPVQVFGYRFAYASLKGRESNPWSKAFEQMVESGFPPADTMHLWFLYDLLFITMTAAAVVWCLDRLGLSWGWGLQLVRRCVEGPWLCLAVFSTLNALWFVPLEWSVLPTSASWFPEPVILTYYLLCYGLGWIVFASKAELSSFQLRARTFVGLGFACVLVRGVAWAALAAFGAEEGVDPPPEAAFWFFVRCTAACVALVALTRGFTGVFLRYASSGSAFWRYVSDSSYWVYLVHAPLAYFVPPLMVHWNVPALLKCLLALALVSALCWSSYDFLVRPTAIGRLLNGRTYPAAAPKLSAVVFLLLISGVSHAGVNLISPGALNGSWRDGMSAGSLLAEVEVQDPYVGPALELPGADVRGCVGVDQYAICPAPLAFQDAIVSCAALGGLPLTLESEEENRRVTTLLERLSDREFWVAATDAAEEGQWVWPDGSRLMYDPWAEGEPNDWGGREDCAATNWKGSNRWNDLPCRASRAFVCEFDAPGPRKKPAP